MDSDDDNDVINCHQLLAFVNSFIAIKGCFSAQTISNYQRCRHLNALELSCNVITSPGVTESWLMQIVKILVLMMMMMAVMMTLILVMLMIMMMRLLMMQTYVCMDVNGFSSTELGLPSPMDG